MTCRQPIRKHLWSMAELSISEFSKLGVKTHKGLQYFEPSGKRGKEQREGGRGSGGDMHGIQSRSACWALQQEPIASPLGVAGSLEPAGRGGREAAHGPILGCMELAAERLVSAAGRRIQGLWCWNEPPSLAGSCSTKEGRGVCAATTDGAGCPVRVLCLLHTAMTTPSQVPWGVGGGGE